MFVSEFCPSVMPWLVEWFIWQVVMKDDNQSSEGSYSLDRNATDPTIQGPYSFPQQIIRQQFFQTVEDFRLAP